MSDLSTVLRAMERTMITILLLAPLEGHETLTENNLDQANEQKPVLTSRAGMKTTVIWTEVKQLQ